jgi:hypothetical protein
MFVGMFPSRRTKGTMEFNRLLKRTRERTKPRISREMSERKRIKMSIWHIHSRFSHTGGPLSFSAAILCRAPGGPGGASLGIVLVVGRDPSPGSPPRRAGFRFYTARISRSPDALNLRSLSSRCNCEATVRIARLSQKHGCFQKAKR